MPSHAFDLRKPCVCGSTAGRIENRNGQNCVFCVKCDDYQYNAPRAEVDRYRQSVVEQLAAFLNARLEEDDQAARAATPGRWRVTYDPLGTHVENGDGAGRIMMRSGADRGDGLGEQNAAHIAHHGPTRVLAEVEAKRRMLAEHSGVDPCDAHDASLQTVPCDTLLLLALPYADHRDYREEWRP